MLRSTVKHALKSTLNAVGYDVRNMNDPLVTGLDKFFPLLSLDFDRNISSMSALIEETGPGRPSVTFRQRSTH